MKRRKHKKENEGSKASEVPNKKTEKALKDSKLFTAKNALEMIRDALGDPNWQPRLDPDDEDAKFCKTKLMEKAGELLNSGGSPQDPVAKKVAAAIDIYTRIIEQDQSYPRVWTQRGLAKLLGVRYFDAEYLDEEAFANYKTALPDLDRAIEEDGEDGDAYAYRAEIHWRCGRNDSALEDLQRAFDLSARGWAATADEMYHNGVELPEEILDGLREEGYIDSDDDEK
jgi:tetratricopeptide (TPR) repeat protein